MVTRTGYQLKSYDEYAEEQKAVQAQIERRQARQFAQAEKHEPKFGSCGHIVKPEDEGQECGACLDRAMFGY